MLTCFKRSPPLHVPVEENGLQFERVSSAKVLVVTIRNDFKWNDHVKDPVLSIMHCALQKSAAIFLMLKNPVGLIAFCNPFPSAMSVVKRLFMYLIY